MKKYIVYIFIIPLLMTGCSNKQLNENEKSYNSNYCISNSTSDAEYSDCMRNQKIEKEQDKVLKNK